MLITLQLCIPKLKLIYFRGFIFGPLAPEEWQHCNPHMISTFVRYQKNDNSVRVITDCSFPAGQSLNDANKPDIRLEYPYVMAQPADIARAVLDWGAGTDLRIVKIDMSNAFKNLPVKATAWRKQTLEFCNVFFVDGRLLFGSDLSAHSFVFFHLGLQLLFIMPFIKATAADLHLAIDDSTMIGPSANNMCSEYEQRYRHVVTTLNIGMKEHDPGLEKAFSAVEAGQALGINFNLPSRSWFASDAKRRDLSETIEILVDPAKPHLTRFVTINDLQRIIGLLASFARLSKLGKSLMLVPAAEMNFWLHQYSEENLRVKPDKQSKKCFLSFYARKNIIYWRAILVESHNYHLPLEDSRILSRKDGVTHHTLFTDASGALPEISPGKYKPTCLGVFSPHSLHSPEATLTAFVLPHCFLAGSDQWGPVHHNTCLLELLPVIAELLYKPAKYRRRSVTVYTDNQGTVAIFTKQNSKRLYAAYFLEVLNYMLCSLEIKLIMKWKARRSSYAMEMADDATHAVFDKALPGTICTRQTLPAPLQSVLLSTTEYRTHTLNTLRKQVKLYLVDRFPDLSFPH